MKKDPIREYFLSKRANFETVRHPFINDSVLVKVGHKYLYFLTRQGTKKVDMYKFFAAYCQ
jgi:hypothetical protein